MRKQFMMMIQKSMMQVLNNPNLMDMSINPMDELNPVNPMAETSIPFFSEEQQSHLSNQSSIQVKANQLHGIKNQKKT